MKFHIVASTTNTAAVQRVARMIVDAGHDVWDWTQDPPPAEYANESMPEWSTCIPNFRYRWALSRSCAEADMVVCLDDGDFEAGRQFGIAYALSIPAVNLPTPESEKSFSDELADPSWLLDMLKVFYPPNPLQSLRGKA